MDETGHVFLQRGTPPFTISLGLTLLLLIVEFGYLSWESVPRVDGYWPSRIPALGVFEFVPRQLGLQTVSTLAAEEEQGSAVSGSDWDRYRSRSWLVALALSAVGIHLTAILFWLVTGMPSREVASSYLYLG